MNKELDIIGWCELKIKDIEKMDESHREHHYQHTIRMLGKQIKTFEGYQKQVEEKIQGVKKMITAALGGKK